eukprot:COSAG05_NODE_14642_length_391_cov_1.082192_1_plen_57_part_01
MCSLLLSVEATQSTASAVVPAPVQMTREPTESPLEAENLAQQLQLEALSPADQHAME